MTRNPIVARVSRAPIWRRAEWRCQRASSAAAAPFSIRPSQSIALIREAIRSFPACGICACQQSATTSATPLLDIAPAGKARAAYSHSAAVGKRNDLPVRCDSHAA